MHIASWIWVLIPLTAIGVKGFRSWLWLKERQLDRQTDETAERAARYASQVERLEQRVQVLERILTDRSTALSDEIERLRDAPLN